MMAEADPWRTLQRDYESGLRLLRQPDREVYVAVHGGSVVGFVILCLVGGFVGYLQTIAVREDWRSLGLGRQLIAFAEDRIFAEYPNVFICVSSFNPRARALYDALGYEVVGPIRDFVVSGHDEVLLRKTRGPLYEHS
jgi:ribosomal protein S18 acetylase RimI-like enzyme